MRCVHEVRGADGDSLCGLEERGNACIRSKGLAYSDCERFEEDGGMSTGFSVQVSEKMAAYLVEMYANQITTASMGGGGMVELGAVDNVQLIKNVATITAHLTGNNRDLAEKVMETVTMEFSTGRPAISARKRFKTAEFGHGMSPGPHLRAILENADAGPSPISTGGRRRP